MSAIVKQGVGTGDVRRMLDLVTATARSEAATAQRVQFALRGLMELTRAGVGVVAHVRREAGKAMQIESLIDYGWATASDRAAVVGAAGQPGFVDPVLDAMFGLEPKAARPSVTATRREFFDDTAWYGSPHVTEVKRPGHIDECVYSIYHLGRTGHYACLGLHRAWGDKTRFTVREQQVADFVWHSLSYLHASPLTTGGTDPARLDPELAPVFRLLRSGATLTNAPRKLGLSRQAYHTAVERIYAHYAVTSRIGLLAKLAEE